MQLLVSSWDPLFVLIQLVSAGTNYLPTQEGGCGVLQVAGSPHSQVSGLAQFINWGGEIFQLIDLPHSSELSEPHPGPLPAAIQEV